MKTFTNTVATKGQLLENIKNHMEADAFIKGIYWNDASKKGCAVGCSIVDFGGEPANHTEYERLFGIPTEIARLEDAIFEGLPLEDSKLWPLRFTNAVPVGVDLHDVFRRFKLAILEKHLVYNREKHPQVARVVDEVIELLRENLPQTDSRWNAARDKAWNAADSMVESVEWNAAESAAESAAWCAAWCASRNIVWCVADSAARSVSWQKLADEIICILEETE